MSREIIDEDTVRHIALLSRLECSDAEIRKFAGDLNAILATSKNSRSSIPTRSNRQPMQCGSRTFFAMMSCARR